MKKLRSVFTEDMDHCYFTGAAPVERHHVFGGANRKLSEKYGFVVPLRPDLHPNGAGATWSEQLNDLDLFLKRQAQIYYEKHYGTREDFRNEFGRRSWL